MDFYVRFLYNVFKMIYFVNRSQELFMYPLTHHGRIGENALIGVPSEPEILAQHGCIRTRTALKKK